VTAEEVRAAERAAERAVRVPGTRWIAGGMGAVLVAAVCMRPALTAVGPVLGLIGADTGLSHTMLGLLSALPLLAFAAVSPVVHGPVRRIGIERTVAWALVGLAAGSAFRAVPGLSPLWVGTAVAGAGIAVCNVLIPVVIRRDQPRRVPLMTAVYSATMGTAAALASGVSQPLSDLPGGWRLSLGIWAVPAAVAAVVWMRRRSRAAAEPEPDLEDPTPVWRSVGAWRLTAVMGLQSTTFYIMVAWLPSIATSYGASDAVGGWYLFAYQAVGILAGLGLPTVLRRAGTPRAGILVSVPLVIACLGIVTLPAALPAWVLLAGISSGAALVYALTRISLAARTSAHATRLSGMAQSVGYLFAASGPVVVGWLRDSTGSWTPALAFVAVLATVQATAAALRLRAP
jgi:CP family cyanate transporter-like MFS transporter